MYKRSLNQPRALGTQILVASFSKPSINNNKIKIKSHTIFNQSTKFSILKL